MQKTKILKTTENTSLDDLYNRQTAYFLEKIKEVQVEKYPFLHFEYQNLFLDEFFDYMKWIMPDVDELKSMVEVANEVSKIKKDPWAVRVPSSYPKERKILPIADAFYEDLLLDIVLKNPANKKKYIRLHNWFVKIFMPAVCDKMDIDISTVTNNELLYTVDQKGYYLNPHTDIHIKILSVLIYMPDDFSLKNEGTNLLEHKNSNFTDQGKNVLHDNASFNLIKTSKFIPNNTLVFKRSNKSFHSVSPVNVDSSRKLLIFTVFNNNIKR